MPTNRKYGALAALIICIVLALSYPSHAQLPQGRACHVLGLPLTGSLTIPSCAEGGNLNASAIIQQLVIVNTDTVTHTATITDCQGTPFQLLPAATLQPNTTNFLTANGIRMGGCFKWSASSTTVQGSVTAANQ